MDESDLAETFATVLGLLAQNAAKAGTRDYNSFILFLPVLPDFTPGNNRFAALRLSEL